VLHGYGHWLSNDPRGSGSTEVRKDELQDLGEIHFGRKRVQPSREELRAFYREAETRLEFPVVWFRKHFRDAIGAAFEKVIGQKGYTVWACAVCSNHAHLLVRTHRDRAEIVWNEFATASRDALRVAGMVPERHPVWSHRPYKVFLYLPAEVDDRVGYVEKNPIKEGLPRQTWGFVKPCPYRVTEQ
jgi:REP element-mobilizing transposase RayT